MLTALDFPDGLLYSRDAIWLREGGAGSARLGLNSYAAFEGEADVYLVKLPKAGAKLRRGEPFGHLDLGLRTVPLVAPVSGEVLYPNTALRDEPGLVALEPFGRGFLLEIEGVAGEEMDDLYDRDDAVAHFGRFEPEGLLKAEHLIEPGRAWPSIFSVRFGEGTVIRGRLMPPLGNDVFTPDWVAGDTWAVETQAGGSGGPERRFAYEVLGRGRVAGEEVMRVRVTEVPVPGSSPAAGKPADWRVLHFRTDDFTLAAVDLVPFADPLAVRRRWNPRGPECWLETRDPKDGLLLDHPKLPVGVDDEARDLPEGANKKALPAVSHYVKFRGGLTRIEAELRADIEREDGRGTERLVSLIRFERGELWWTEAVRTLGEKELVKAKLVRS